MGRDFTDPDTVFRLIKSDSPVTVDGVPMGVPTGDVRCEECGRTAKNIDEIPHKQHCSQRFVHSGWYRDQAVVE